MLSSTLLFCAAALGGVGQAWPLSGPATRPHDLISRSTPSSTGTSNGFYYSFWNQGGGGDVTYTNGAGGAYDVTWKDCTNFVAGKGWQTGGPKTIVYNGTWSGANVNSYLSVYGWTKSPLVEYYIVESYGSFDPSSQATKKGSVTVDGATYDLLESTRTNQPSIQGTATFQQYWAVRQQKRVGGRVNTQAFYDAWEKAGMSLGTHDYMILATEGYQSSGSAHITVGETLSASKSGSIGASGGNTMSASKSGSLSPSGEMK